MNEPAHSTGLDPQAAAFLKLIGMLPPLKDVPLEVLRTELPPIFYSQPLHIKIVEDMKIPACDREIPVRIYVNSLKERLPIALYFHGGGWVAGCTNFYDNVCRSIARKSGYIVASVDYSLAPEHPFPAGLVDCCRALEWAAGGGGFLGGDGRRIAVCGDSAGGNLAAALALKSRDERGPAIGLQVLIYPSLDLSNLDTQSYRLFHSGYYLQREDVEYFRSLYLPNPSDWKNPYASPLLHENHAGLPPALIITDEFDVLRDEGEAYAEKLRSSGVDVKLSRYAGMIHGFICMPTVDASHRATDEIAAALRTAFDR